jgi:hypothetical protein
MARSINAIQHNAFGAIRLSIVMHCVVMQSVNMVSVFMLSVVMLNVVVPFFAHMLNVVRLRVASLSKLVSWIQIKILNEYS